MKFVFFGSSDFSVYVLNELKSHNIIPDLIITTPDKPKGRKLILTPTSVKIWAGQNNIEVISPNSLKNNPSLVSKLKALSPKLFLVASYGNIIPKEIFEIPGKKTLNIHPSLLPKYRGASPLQSQILNNEKEVGVTIIQINQEMDAGPIVAKRQLSTFNFQLSIPGRKELEKKLAIEGAQLFAHILPEWLKGTINPIMQNEKDATYCQKIEKRDGELQIDLENLSKNAQENFLKIKAFEDWPGTYFFSKNKRIIITNAILEDDKLKILKVKPEGKSEMTFEDFLRGIK
ncbi:MAG: methionyl-tRNA formyltransferase [Candidatus Zambryskibacteria bacterium]|nr:methionyl-tRNA formyltransferase [Candidatus Zambryskibacteria bacterium]